MGQRQSRPAVEILARLYSPDGHFDGSECGMKLMTWREAGTLKVIDDYATRKKYHRPGLLATLWKGEKVKEATSQR